MRYYPRLWIRHCGFYPRLRGFESFRGCQTNEGTIATQCLTSRKGPARSRITKSGGVRPRPEGIREPRYERGLRRLDSYFGCQYESLAEMD